MWRLAMLFCLTFAAAVYSDDAFGKYYTDTGDVFSMIAVPGGSVIAAHHSSIGGQGEILVMKIQSNGRIVWKQAFKSDFALQGTRMIQTSDGGFAITGMRYSSAIGPTDILLMRLNSEGKLNWVKKYFTSGWDTGDQIVETKNGGFLIFSNAGLDFVLLRVDSTGNLLWTRSWEAYFPESLALKQLQDGHFAAAITTSRPVNPNISAGMAVLTFTSGGAVAGEVEIDSTSGTQFTQVVFLADGGFAATGRFYPNQNEQMFIALFNRTGKVLWKKAYTFDRHLEASDIQQATNGDLIIAGNLYGHDFRAFVLRVSLSGKVLNTVSFGKDLFQSAGNILPLNDKQLLLSGNIDFNTFKADWSYIFKLDSENAQGCSTFTNESFNSLPPPLLQTGVPKIYVKTPAEYIVTSPAMDSYSPLISGHYLCH